MILGKGGQRPLPKQVQENQRLRPAFRNDSSLTSGGVCSQEDVRLDMDK